MPPQNETLLAFSLGAGDLLRRWTAMDEFILYRLIRAKVLSAYICEGQSYDKKTERYLHRCFKNGTAELIDGPLGSPNARLCWKNVRFSIYDVIQYEQMNVFECFLTFEEWQALSTTYQELPPFSEAVNGRVAPSRKVPQTQMLTLRDVISRWPGAEVRLWEFWQDGQLTDFGVDEKFQYISRDELSDDEYVLNKRVPLSEVQRLEEMHPELTIKLVSASTVRAETAARLREAEARGDAKHEAVRIWGEAIEKSSLRGKQKLRLKIMLRRKTEKLAVVQMDYPRRNIQRDVRDAISQDAPELKKQFPNLPDIPGDID